MITESIGDIFDTDPLNAVIMHQANCQCVMGAGIAKLIKKRYPDAYEMDQLTKPGDRSKLGTFSWVEQDHRVIINAYTQFEVGGRRPTNYEAVARAMMKVKDFLEERYNKENAYLYLTIPYGYGCGLGGGSWRVVRAIIESTFEDAVFNVEIIRLPTQAELK